jgi:hypothetical protein
MVSPHFLREHIDVTSGERAMAFQVQAGDGRIYLRAG